MALGDEVAVINDPTDEPEEEEEEEDLIDPVDDIRDACSKSEACVNMKDRLEKCNDRVSSKTETTESCHEEMIDYIHALDSCVSKSLFNKLV